MGATSFRDSDSAKFLRGVVVIIAAAFMILPAYVNYELGPTKLGFSPVVSMGISLQFFAIGVILFILAVGKERFVPKSQPQ
jgi:hypothetical protein